jgi:hypothetical protein
MCGWIVQYPAAWRDVLGSWATQVWFGFLLLNMFVGGTCLDLSLSFWLSMMTHQAVTVPFWPCAIVGAVFGRPILGFIMATWFVAMFR